MVDFRTPEIDQPGPPDLGNNANNCGAPGQGPEIGVLAVPAPDPAITSRARALELRERLWSVSSLARVRSCGKTPRTRLLEVVDTPRGARLIGLCHCGSVWVCPVCAPLIRSGRAVEIALALELHLVGSGGVTFGTGTMSHGLGNSLRSTYGLVSEAWSGTRQARAVRAFRKAHGYVGFIRTVEVTWGEVNGWNPHTHWLDFWETVLTSSELAEYHAAVFAAWSSTVRRLGGRVASREHGVRVLNVSAESASTDRLGEYLTEISPMGAGHELTAISTKQGRLGGLAPFDLLGKVYGPGSKPWVDLWWEFEKATHGRRMLNTSSHMLDRLGLLPDDPQPLDVGERLAVVTADVWSDIRWNTAAGLSGAQEVIEAAAARGGQVAVNEAVRLLLGGVEQVPERGPDSVQLQLGPGDDGGMF